MKKLLIALTLAAFVAGCAGTGLDTSAKNSVAFCQSYASVMGKMSLLNRTGNLTPHDVASIDNAVAVITPYCTATYPGEPTVAVINALDVLLLLVLTRGA